MRALLVCASCCLIATALVARPDRAETINVAAAISLKESLQEIARAYAADTGDRVEFTFGASGQLMAQIKNGAPIDAFISAANKQVDDLDKAGLIDAKTRRVVAGNSLVLIVPADAPAGLSNFKGLADDRIRRLAIGEPRTVPVGQYAQQVLRKLELEQRLSDGGRLVYGSNVRQVLDYVERGEVGAGIVYATDAREAGDAKVKVVATADPTTHEPIVYPGVLVKTSRKREAAVRFLDYLGSDKARKVFEAKGFAPAQADAASGKPSK
jgi:molybdate transport system substrate-binding protein